MNHDVPEGFNPPEPPGVEKISERWEGNVQYVILRREGRTYEEKRVWMAPFQSPEITAKEHKLQESLPDFQLGISNRMGRTKAWQLVVALAECQWQFYPATVSIPIIAREACSLKTRIASVLGTKDPKVIEKVLSIDIGYAYPPQVDFEVRDSLMEEIKAIEEWQHGGGTGNPR